MLDEDDDDVDDDEEEEDADDINDLVGHLGGLAPIGRLLHSTPCLPHPDKAKLNNGKWWRRHELSTFGEEHLCEIWLL